MNRVLLISPGDPWTAHRGYATRTADWLDALEGKADVTLVAPVGENRKPGVRVVVPRMRTAGTIRCAVAMATRRLPLQCLLTGRYDWSGALETAADYGPFDATIVVMSRTAPWLGELATSKRRILDAIDSLAANARERARAAALPGRLFWQREARVMNALELGLGTSFDEVLVVSPSDAAAFGKAARVIPIGVAVSEPARAKEWDFGFTGRLAYFANRKSVELLLDDIWPAVRQEAPDATLLIAGADAPRAIMGRHGRDGITVISPFRSARELLSRVRVALLPVTHGSGQSLKTIEAAEAGCAIVGTSLAFRGAELLRDACVVRDDAQGLARAAVAMLRNDAAEEVGSQARAIVVRHYAKSTLLPQLAEVVTGGRA